MNETIKLLQNHRSNRNFVKGHLIPRDEVNEIIKSIKQAPSWMNGQQYSVIVVDDQKLKDEIYSYTTRNKHIETSSVFFIFLADLTKQKIATDIKGKEFSFGGVDTLINTTTDTVLAMQNAAIAAESLGYGTVFCGGIKTVADKIIKLFNLPKYVYPICGLSVGKLDEELTTERIKPRFSDDTNIGFNSYAIATKQQIEDYDKVLEVFAEKRETKIWSQKFADIYNKETQIANDDTLKNQGFEF